MMKIKVCLTNLRKTAQPILLLRFARALRIALPLSCLFLHLPK